MEAEVLLDTHVLVWLYAGEVKRLSDKSQNVIEEADLFVSPISILEIDFLHEIGRIRVRSGVVLDSLSESIELKVASDSFMDVIKEAGHVTWTRDPFDRLLVAHARLRGIPLVTKDRTLRRHYSRCLW